MDASDVVADPGPRLVASGAGVLLARHGPRRTGRATTTGWRTWTRRRCRRSTGRSRLSPRRLPPAEGGGGGGGGDGAERGGGEPVPGSCPTWVLAAAPDAVSPVCTKHGDPESVSLNILSRDASAATLELHTGGFWTLQEPSGTVRVFVPGFDFPTDPKAPALPLRRALVDAVVGKQVELVSAEAFELQSFQGLRPSAVGAAEMSVSRDGTVRPARRSLAPRLLSRGLRAAGGGASRGDGVPGGEEERGRGDHPGALRRLGSEAGPGRAGAGEARLHGGGGGGERDGERGPGAAAEGSLSGTSSRSCTRRGGVCTR